MGLYWDQAEQFCQGSEPGAHLASIHSQDENDFIIALFPDDYPAWEQLVFTGISVPMRFNKKKQVVHTYNLA